jgi:hypothetical protein
MTGGEWEATMTTLTRAQISRSILIDPAHGVIDTSVKTSRGPWRAFAPTWAMVLGFKNGQVSETEYTAQYVEILNRVPETVWSQLAALPVATVCCYCRDTWFCHTHVLIDYAVRRWPGRFTDGRPASQQKLAPPFPVPIP